ncbi:MAG: hypothetical protein NW223_12770 [Hyphomicrobiaceae bacterium]|nr:hypothetical protein [Hyphomicrobiaceae bacterium]
MYRKTLLRDDGLWGALMRVNFFSRCALAIVFCIAPYAAIPSHANDCSVQQRELGGVKGAPTVASTACPVAAGSTERFHVTFLRLNEVLAGALAMGEVLPEITPFFGDKGLVANPVAEEIETIFKRFGRKQVFDAKGIGLVMNARGVARSELEWRSFEVRPQSSPSQVRRMWTITHALDSLETRYPIFDKAASTTIYKTDRWPQNFKMFYQCSDRSVFECVTLWRFLAAADLDVLAQDTEEDEKVRAEDGRYTPPEAPATEGIEKSEWPLANSHRTHFEFFKYLTRGGWHAKFGYMSIDTTAKGCGDTIDSGYFTRPIALDIAVVENSTRQRLSIKALLVSQGAQTVVRTVESDDKQQGAGTTIPANLTIEPGQKAVVPLRIVLLDPTKSMDVDDLRTTSMAMHRKAQSARLRDLEFTVYENGEERKGRKRASAYKAPELPSMPELAYGPSLRLNGLKLEADELAVKSAQSELALTTDTFSFDQGREDFHAAPEVHLVQNLSGKASCPYLYAWNDREKTWVNHGKVIEHAEGEEREAVEEIRFEGDVRRIRLAEDEAEDAFIRDVRLVREFADGTTQELRPLRRQAGGRHAAPQPAGMTAKIPAFSYVEFEFAAPTEQAPSVRSSTVVVGGYYIRHSTLQSQRVARQD